MDLTWVLALLSLILVIYFWGTWTHKHFDNANIPFDKPTPFIGNMGSFVFRRRSFGEIFEDLYNKYRGSGLIGFFQFRQPTVILRDPELIKLVTVKAFDHFTDHAMPIGEQDDPLFGKFISALKGDRWKYMRSTLSPAFTSSKMKSMFHLVADCGTQLGDFLETKCKENGGMVSTDMKDLYTRFTNDVIATSAFGIHCDSLQQPTNEFYVMGKRAVDLSGAQMFKFFGFLLSTRLMRFLNIQFVRKDVNSFFQNLVKSTIVKRQKEHIVRPDMIHLLMEAQKGTLKVDNPDELRGEVKHDVKRTPLTDEDITAQAFLFFLAGFDPASTHLCFLSHLLATNPEILARVQDEIDGILEESNGKITYEGLQKMKYTEMVMNEALRLWPPAVRTDRICVKPYTIPATDTNPSLHLKVGEAIMLPILALHRDPEYFENPLEFDPERFNDENKHKIRPFTYIPFGAGPRNCIGMRFAQMETKIALTCLLSRFDLKVVSKTPEKLNLNKKGFNMSVDGGFWLGITPRNKV